MLERMLCRLGGVLVGGLLLGGCASTPGWGVPSHYAQDSVSARCMQNPIYCATVTGRDVATTGTVEAVDTTVAATGMVLHSLELQKKNSIQEALQQCADLARTEVLMNHRGAFEGLVPKAGECKAMTVDSTGRSVTWAMRLGLEMHEVALKCAEARLGGLGLRFSLKQRYRFNRATKEKSLISPEEKAALLRQGGEALKGTLEPDVVIHTGDPLQVLAVYDFKFRCVDFDTPPKWRDYPEGHMYEGKTQGDIYKEAFGSEPKLIGPRKGVFW